MVVCMNVTESIDADPVNACTLDMDWQLTEEERDGVMAPGLDPQTRL